MTPNDWILSDNTNVSSITIWAVMMGSADFYSSRADIPCEPLDFEYCYRLLQYFPEWRGRLQEVTDAFPKWGPMVAAWDELTLLYKEEVHTGSVPKLSAKMEETRILCIATGNKYANKVMQKYMPLPAYGRHGFDGSCVPGSPMSSSQSTFSVGLFQWLPKGFGGLKRSAVKLRVKGYISQQEKVYATAREMCEKLDAGWEPNRKNIAAN